MRKPFVARAVGCTRQPMRALWVTAVLYSAVSLADDSVDLSVVYRIKNEAFTRSKVMDHLFWLTDVNGSRLTNSPGFESAATWAAKTLEGYGAKTRREKWGPFGRGWSNNRCDVRLTQPVESRLDAVPLAWTGATPGLITAEPIYAPLLGRDQAQDRFDLAKFDARIAAYAAENRGKLAGKVVLLVEPRPLTLPSESERLRYDDAKLSQTALAPEPIFAPPLEWPITKPPAGQNFINYFLGLPLPVSKLYGESIRRTELKLYDFFKAEKVAAVLRTDDRGEGGLIFAESLRGFDSPEPPATPVLVLAPEHYNRVARLVEKKVPVSLSLDVQSKFHDATDAFNVIGELPGGKKKDEVVMLGAHLDSWHSATGATDNAAGVAVVMEALRILTALKLPLDRTVRIALWSGEEQGLRGSSDYVEQHFGDMTTLKLKPEHAKLSAYFNLDNGSGKIRGVYLQGNDMARPVFEKWFAPFRDLGVGTIAIRDTYGTDHQPFDAVGLPGFQFIQDPLDYSWRTHHSSLDAYDHAQPADLMQAAAIVAAVVYQAANREQLMPREPVPAPLPPKKTK